MVRTANLTWNHPIVLDSFLSKVFFISISKANKVRKVRWLNFCFSRLTRRSLILKEGWWSGSVLWMLVKLAQMLYHRLGFFRIADPDPKVLTAQDKPLFLEKCSNKFLYFTWIYLSLPCICTLYTKRSRVLFVLLAVFCASTSGNVDPWRPNSVGLTPLSRDSQST